MTSVFTLYSQYGHLDPSDSNAGRIWQSALRRRPSRNERGSSHDLATGQIIAYLDCTRGAFEALQQYLKKSSTARAFPEAGYILTLDPLTIRQPDVSVLSKERIAATDAESYFKGAPDLAVEIVSPSDSAQDLQLKVNQYLAAGARQVWVLNFKTKSVHVFSGSSAPQVFNQNHTLPGGDLLPGFAVKVADLFAV